MLITRKACTSDVQRQPLLTCSKASFHKNSHARPHSAHMVDEVLYGCIVHVEF